MSSLDIPSEKEKPFVESDRVEIISLERHPQCVVEVYAQPKLLLLEETHKKAVASVRRQSQIPGFRKGKAPLPLIQQRYSAAITAEWYELLNQQLFLLTVELIALTPARQGTIHSRPTSKDPNDTGWAVRYTYETAPQVNLPDADQFTFAVPSCEMSPARIEKQLERLQWDKAEWNQVEGRAVQEGDWVVVSLYNLLKEEAIVEEALFAIDQFPQESKGLLLGMMPGEVGEKEIMLKDLIEPTEQISPEQLEEKLLLRLTLHSIKQPMLPPLDDAFAKQCGKATLDELREVVEKVLQYEDLSTRRAAIKEALMESMAYQLPKSFSQRLRKDLIEQQPSKTPEEIYHWCLVLEKQACWKLIRSAIEKEFGDQLIPDEDSYRELMTNLLTQEPEWLASLKQMAKQERELAISNRVKNTVIDNKILDFYWERYLQAASSKGGDERAQLFSQSAHSSSCKEGCHHHDHIEGAIFTEVSPEDALKRGNKP